MLISLKYCSNQGDGFAVTACLLLRTWTQTWLGRIQRSRIFVCVPSPAGQTARTHMFFTHLYLWVCNGSGNQGEVTMIGMLSCAGLFSQSELSGCTEDRTMPVKSKHKSFTWPTVTPISVLFSLLAMGFPGGSAAKESACNAGDLGWEDPLENDHFKLPRFLSCSLILPHLQHPFLVLEV